MASEYKISTILRSSSEIKVLARFYNTAITSIKVTKINNNRYPENKIGDITQKITRIKYLSDFTYKFSPVTTDEQIYKFLYREALKYGEPVNKQTT
jgi:hypothetical protein